MTQTGVVYSRKVNEQALTFGVSGKLYKSNVLFYDHQTDSLWSQLLSQAISGKNVGTHLTKIPSSRMKWKSWKKRNPKTFVLSTDTGFIRNYDRDPYKGYYRIGKLWFPVGDVRKDLPPKSRVLGVVINGKAKAYPLQELEKNRTDLLDQNDGEKILIVINKDGEAVKVEDAKGNTVHHIFAYWFAWQAFHPETKIYMKK